MVFTLPFTRGETKKAMLNVQEAYGLWDLVTTKYGNIDKLQIWISYAHDTDFKYYLRSFLNAELKNIELIEAELKKYSIAGPDKPMQGLSSSVNPEIITDQRLGLWFLTTLQEEIELMLRAIRTTTTNDAIRGLFIKLAIKRLEDLDNVFKYVKLKGWINQPPIYPNIPSGTKEIVDTGEAFHLWDHLTYRYDNIQQTQFWYEYAHDGDFKILLKKGLQGSLKKEATILEDELIKFGIPLPKHPSEIIQTAEDTTILNDDYMFRLLNTGIMGALWLHSLAVKQCTTNDRIRTIFKNLLITEIKSMDKIFMIGKLKGWLNVPPNYSPTL